MQEVFDTILAAIRLLTFQPAQRSCKGRYRLM
ncbi:hypothetical protein J2Z50_001539 [Ensifer mexicanus]|nr:hypothetical protein [Sinorhizobium mexicanum]